MPPPTTAATHSRRIRNTTRREEAVATAQQEAQNYRTAPLNAGSIPQGTQVLQFPDTSILLVLPKGTPVTARKFSPEFSDSLRILSGRFPELTDAQFARLQEINQLARDIHTSIQETAQACGSDPALIPKAVPELRKIAQESQTLQDRL